MDHTLLTAPGVSLWAVLPSHSALFKVSARWSVGAICAASMALRATAVATAWPLASVVAARLCRRIRRWKCEKWEMGSTLLRSRSHRWCIRSRSSNGNECLETSRKEKISELSTIALKFWKVFSKYGISLPSEIPKTKGIWDCKWGAVCAPDLIFLPYISKRVVSN